MISHTAPQHFSSPAGPVFIQVFSPSTASAGLDTHVLLVSGSCLPELVPDDVCRRIPDFAESGIEPLSSVLGTFVKNTGIPLRYHCDDSVVVFRYS